MKARKQQVRHQRAIDVLWADGEAKKSPAEKRNNLRRTTPHWISANPSARRKLSPWQNSAKKAVDHGVT
jgi:hypothetical protein